MVLMVLHLMLLLMMLVAVVRTLLAAIVAPITMVCKHLVVKLNSPEETQEVFENLRIGVCRKSEITRKW